MREGGMMTLMPVEFSTGIHDGRVVWVARCTALTRPLKQGDLFAGIIGARSDLSPESLAGNGYTLIEAAADLDRLVADYSARHPDPADAAR